MSKAMKRITFAVATTLILGAYAIALPELISFLLKPASGFPEERQGKNQQITIPRGADMVRLWMEIEKGDSRRFQAIIRSVGGSQVWSQ
jgi:hypothetical protein